MVNLLELEMMLIWNRLMFGFNIGLQRIGLDPDFSDEGWMRLRRRILLSREILLSRGGLVMFFMLRMLKKKVHYNRDYLKKGIDYVSRPCFSLIPRNFCFKLFARIKGRSEYSIAWINILPSDNPSLIHLHIKTLCKPPKPWHMSHLTYIQMMPKDDRVYEFDVNKVSTRELKDRRSKATQNSISICAIRGEYSATDIDNGSLKVSWQGKVSRIVRNAHGWLICATAFHQNLPFLATYCGLKEEKRLKIWFIPSELSSDPVLVSSFHIPDGCVLSVRFHPTLPLIFCGKDNGDIEVWKMVYFHLSFFGVSNPILKFCKRSN